MRGLFLLPFLAALGCNRGGLTPEDLSCQYDPHDWYDNAFYTLLQADDSGAWDFDPIGDSIVGRVGSYGFETGDYESVNSYAEEHPYIEVSAEGYGTIYANGDLDLISKSIYRDVLDDSWAVQTRTERSGCSGSVRTSELDLDAAVDSQPDEWAETTTWEVEIVADDQVDRHTELDEEYGLYIYDSTSTPDVAAEASWDYADGGYVGTRTTLYDGTGQANWTQSGAAFDSSSDFVGADTYYFDGSVLRDYDAFEAGSSTLAAEVELLYLYDGSATGSYVAYQDGSVIECDVTITAGGEDCTMYCSGYGEYDC